MRRHLPKLRFWSLLYLLLLPTIASMAVFAYYPKADVVVKSLFRWVPEQVEEFVGFGNYIDAFRDPLFWQSFELVGILLVANLVKMWPAIFAAVALHRMTSDRWRYVYQVLFVVPMVIPGLVWLLIWKGFYDPDFGIVNRLLNATGAMEVLHWLDGTEGAPGVMPRIAAVLGRFMDVAVDPLFGSVWGMLLAAVLLLAAARLLSPGHRLHGRPRRAAAATLARRAGWALATLSVLLVFFGRIWTEPTGQFAEGTPAWLGNKDLVIPAVIFWGFPWVGTIGVLIYLSGLQQISQDVYEAAELDGVGPLGMLFRIELPLIMTQVRINLIFMTIGTLTAYEFFLLLLGTDGGPGNKGMVPGLYMFKKAFEDGQFGYACALGMVLFVLIMALTIVYNKYVKVEK